jgi:sorbose reductase
MPLAKPNTSTPILSLFSLADKVCFVTGGSRGIGLEVVRGFAEAGADVAFTYLTTPPDVAKKVAKTVSEATGRRIEAFHADVTKRSEIAAAMDQAVRYFAHLDVVVANAGVCRQISSFEYDEETFDKDYAVNVYGLMWTAQAAGKIFQAQGHGNLIITASVSSVLVNVPQPQTSYNSSKAAAAHLGKNLAVEWVDFARVNSVSPGYVATNSKNSLRDYPKMDADGEHSDVEPTRRNPKQVDIASACKTYGRT